MVEIAESDPNSQSQEYDLSTGYMMRYKQTAVEYSVVRSSKSTAHHVTRLIIAPRFIRKNQRAASLERRKLDNVTSNRNATKHRAKLRWNYVEDSVSSPDLAHRAKSHPVVV